MKSGAAQPAHILAYPEELQGGAMIRLIVCLALISLAITTSSTPCESKPTKDEPKKILVEDILKEIQSTLYRVQLDAKQGIIPPLDSVQIELTTTFSVDGEGKINLYIVTLGGGGSRESAQILKLTLTPPEADLGKGVPSSFTDISTPLAAAIVSAARAAEKAKKQDPPLVLEELIAAIKFIVRIEGGAGLEFQIAPVGVKLGGDIKSGEIQEITIKFKKPDVKKDTK